MSSTMATNSNNNEVIYRAFHLGRKRHSPAYDEWFYSYADLYELHVEKHKLRDVNYSWNLQNPLEKYAVTIGKTEGLLSLQNPNISQKKLLRLVQHHTCYSLKS